MCIYMTPEQKWNYLRAKMKLKKDRKRKKKQEVCGLLGELLHVQHTAV